MRRTHIFLFLAGVAMLCMNAVTHAQVNLRPYNSQSGSGFINSVGVFVIPASFRHVSYFSPEGIAKVEDQKRKHGFIDVKGNYVIAPAFDDLETPYRFDAPMKVTSGMGFDAKYGYINAKGEQIVPYIYDNAYVFRNGYARVTMYGEGPPGRRPVKYGFLDAQGQLVIPVKFDDARSFGANGLAAVLIGDRWGFVNTNGEIAIKPSFDDVPYSPESVFDSFGLAQVKQGKSWILIDAQGKQVGSAKGESISTFNQDGLAVIGQSSFARGRRAGVINTKGEYVFEPQFDDFKGYKNGYAQVSLGGKWGFIDAHGKIVVAPQFPLYSSDFNSGGTAKVVLSVNRKTGGRPQDIELLYGYINTSGKLILQDGQYDRIVRPFNEEGFAVVSKGGKSGFVNREGNESVGWFDDAFPFTKVGLAAVKVDEKWGYVDKSGSWVISPKFDGAYNFLDNGVAIIRQENKWGHINTKGEFIIQPLYDKVGTFGGDGLATATLSGDLGYVDMSGKFTVLPRPAP